nr:hypothetical protein [Nitrosomonas nitrosa]
MKRGGGMVSEYRAAHGIWERAEQRGHGGAGSPDRVRAEGVRTCPTTRGCGGRAGAGGDWGGIPVGFRPQAHREGARPVGWAARCRERILGSRVRS